VPWLAVPPNQSPSTTSDVHLVVLGSPEGGSDMTFRVAGLADPTVVVPRGATVSVEFINGDADTSHGWELLSGRTSFSYMAMMDGNPAFPGAFAMPLGSTSRSVLAGGNPVVHGIHGGYLYLHLPGGRSRPEGHARPAARQLSQRRALTN